MSTNELDIHARVMDWLFGLPVPSIRARSPEDEARDWFRDLAERQAAARRARPMYETELQLSALGTDWTCRVRFQIERYEADVGGGIGIDIDTCHIRPADVRVKSDWIAVDERELDMDAIEQACQKQVAP